MTDPPDRDTRLGPALRESVVIILSILAAFSIDAWWDARGERVQARAFLEALSVDFEAAEAELDRVRGLHELVAAASDQLMTWADGGDPVSACRESADPYTALLARPTFDPPMGTVQTILSSGRADLVPDRTLLRELTNWSALVEDLKIEEQQAIRHLEAEVFPTLRDALDLKYAVRSGPYIWPGAERRDIPCDLVASIAFQSVMYRNWELHQGALREEIPPLARTIEAVKRLVAAGLEE